MPGDSHAHNALNRMQGKLSFQMVVRVEQQDLESSREGFDTRERESQREEKEDQEQISKKVQRH